MKTVKILAISLFVGASVNAQTVEDAIKKTDNERYAEAGKDFRSIIAKNAADANAYFYYGENFLKNDDLDSANIMWKKGNSVDATNPLNVVGMGKFLWFNGDTSNARTHFNNALTLTKKKNAEVLRQIASVFVNAKIQRLNEAISLLDIAVKLEPKNTEGYLIYGDALLEKTPSDASPAIAKYNTALEINPKSSKAIVRTAKIYQRARNYELADSKYKEAINLDPTYAPAYRENAELNMLFNQSNRAIENWKKYLELNNSTEARYRYATSLFSGKKYCEANDELNAIKATGFDNFYVERMLTYSNYECKTGDAKVGIEASEKFFKMVPENKIIASDYKYIGMLYSKAGNDSLALIKFEFAAQKDAAIAAEMYGEMAKIYIKQKNYNKTIEAFTKKMNGNRDNLTATEYYDFGKAYFFGPKNYAEADTCFRVLSEKAPTFTVAYFWLGRCKYKTETPTNKWLGKTSFETFITKLTPEEIKNPSYKSFVMEACKYLGDYYVNSTEYNKEQAKKYWDIVRSLDPVDKQADAFFKSVHAK